MSSIKLWAGSVLLQIVAFIDRSTVSFILGSLSTIAVIIYHVVKIRRELKNKKA